MTGSSGQYLLRSRDKVRLTATLRAIDDATDAFVVTVPETDNSPVLVLAGRPAPYSMPDLATRFPEAITTLADSSLLLTMPMVVGPGATLLISSASTPIIRLASSASGYASLVTVDAELVVEGSPTTPVTVTSYDPAADAADQDLSDGRAYVVAYGGRLQLNHTASSALGFLLGETSGVSWMTRQDRPATGGAQGSTFTANYFGAYASGSSGLLISGSSFTDNVVYGFDPHTGTTNTVIEDSRAARNGRHGFIFSADCSGNIIRNSQSELNGGSGFVIDDGSDDAQEGPRPSDRNTLEGVTARDNRAAGIVIEGGTGNSVVGTRLIGNPTGVWVRNAADQTAIADTTITASDRAGIRLDVGTTASKVTGSVLSDTAVGVWIDGAQGTVLQDVTINNSADAALSLSGKPESTTFTNVVVTGTGKAAVATVANPTAGAIPGEAAGDAAVEPAEEPSGIPAGVDVSGWQPDAPADASETSYTAWVKLVPWFLIVAIPALLWVPLRWRWHRQQKAQFGDAP